MENFKHLPEPFRIRVIEPVKRTTRAYREEAIIKSGMNPFLLDSEDVFIDLLTDSGTGAVTQSMQAAMMRGDEAYSGSRSYYALAESVKNIFGYQYTIPTHQGRGAEQIYIPVLIKKREQEKGLDRSKMVAFSNYFFDTTQGHSQINGCTVRNVYIKEAFDTGVRYDFKGNFDLEGLERGIEEVGPNNVPYIVATITSNSAGGQPVSLANLKVMYSIAKNGKQLPCPAELLRLTIPRATYTQTHMDFIIEAFKHVKENAANIKGLTFTYEPKVLRHFTAKLKEV